MMSTKLRQFREVVPPTRLAHASARGGPGGNIVIPVLGLDPRVVLAISVWVTRATDSQGSAGPAANVAANAAWSLYSAMECPDGVLRALTVVPGFESREIRPADAWGTDGVLRSGDSAEVSTSTALMIAIRILENHEALLLGVNQQLWISVKAYPSDALIEADTEENREAYRGLLEQVRVAVPAMSMAILADAPG